MQRYKIQTGTGTAFTSVLFFKHTTKHAMKLQSFYGNFEHSAWNILDVVEVSAFLISGAFGSSLFSVICSCNLLTLSASLCVAFTDIWQRAKYVYPAGRFSFIKEPYVSHLKREKSRKTVFLWILELPLDLINLWSVIFSLLGSCYMPFSQCGAQICAQYLKCVKQNLCFIWL